MTTQALEVRQSMTLQTMMADSAALAQLRSVVMVEHVDYGTIPGCGDKPALFKPGAEKVLKWFAVAVADIQIEDLSGPGYVRYRLIVTGKTPDGIVRGLGIGECSSQEEKYAWRAATCTEEFKSVPDSARREKWKRGNKGGYKVDQVATNPADVSNTVLKMAKKRATVDLALTACNASALFSQDFEDMSEEMREALAADAVAREASRPSTRAARFAAQVAPPVETAAVVVEPERPPSERPAPPKVLVTRIGLAHGATMPEITEIVRAAQERGEVPMDSDTWTEEHVRILDCAIDAATRPEVE
mgnify:CR=1 FL=1